MKHLIKISSLLFIFIICTACQKKVDPKIYYIEYNENIDYSSLETFKAYNILDGIKYNYTFYFENNRVVNANVEVFFDNIGAGEKFYQNIQKDENYIDTKYENGIVSYFHNIETFNYYHYSKDVLSEMLLNEGFNLLSE